MSKDGEVDIIGEKKVGRHALLALGFYFIKAGKALRKSGLVGGFGVDWRLGYPCDALKFGVIALSRPGVLSLIAATRLRASVSSLNLFDFFPCMA